jgi:predicted GTPase
MAPPERIADASRSVTRVVIMGAAGRDFHDFSAVYGDDPRFEAVAFTVAQITDISGPSRSFRFLPTDSRCRPPG